MKLKRLFIITAVSCAIFSGGTFGYALGLRAQAYMAYIRKDHKRALQLYYQIGDRSGCGMVMLALNDPDRAMEFFKEGNDKSGMGLCCAKKKHLQKALLAFSDGNDKRGMGLTYLGLRDADQAKKCFSDANDWSGLGLVCLTKKDYEGARKCFAKVKDYSGLGNTALEEGKYDEAMKHFSKINDDSGLGLVALERNQYNKAVKHFLKARDYSGLGKVYLALSDFNRAERYFLMGYDYDGLGDMYFKLHQFAKAREAFARDFNPHKVMQSYRNDYTLPDRHQQALDYGQDAVARGDMAPECLLEIADIYYELKRFDDALSALDRASGYEGYDSEVHLRRGRIYFYLRRLREARGEFLRVKNDDLAHPDIYAGARSALAAVERYLSLPPETIQHLKPAQSY